MLASSARFALCVLVSLVAVGGCGSQSKPRPTWPEPLPEGVYGEYLRGRVLMNEGDYEQAARHFYVAARGAPEQSHIAVALGRALLLSGQRDEARRLAGKMRARWPNDVDVWMLSGDIYRSRLRHKRPRLRHKRPRLRHKQPRLRHKHRSEDLARAIEAYQRVVRLDPDHEAAYLDLAAAYLDADKPERAARVYRALVVALPDSLQGNYRLARHLLQRGQEREAGVYLRHVIHLDFKHVAAHLALAKVLRHTGDRAESLEVLSRGFERSGDMRLARQLVAQLLEADERTRAMTLLSHLESVELVDHDVMYVGEMYLRMGEPEAALRVARAWRERTDPDSGARLLEARALSATHAHVEAVALLLAAPANSPAFAESRALAGEILARDGNSQEARDVVAAGLAADPRHVDLHITRALVEELDGQHVKARDLLRRALAEQPSQPGLLYAYGAFEYRQGRVESASAHLRELLELEPENSAALVLLAACLSARDSDLEGAETLLLRALELAPGDPSVLDEYGWLLFNQRRLPEARNALERAARMVPRDPEILWHLSEVYLAQRESRLELDALERARVLHPAPGLRARIEARIQTLRARR